MKKIIFFITIGILNISFVTNIFPQVKFEKEISLPFEYLVNGKEKLIIRENGKIEFRNKVFKYDEIGFEVPDKYDEDIGWLLPTKYIAFVRIYSKNNLCAISISSKIYTVYDTYITKEYSVLLDIKNTRLVPLYSYKYQNTERFWNIYFLGNNFIMVSDGNMNAYNDLTGELLWIQIYDQQKGIPIKMKDNHFEIHDKDGYKYKITSNGIKIREGESLGYPPILPNPTVKVK